MKIKQIIIITIFFIIPLAFALLLFSPKYYDFMKTPDGIFTSKVDNGWRTIVGDFISISLNLNYYQFCFQDLENSNYYPYTLGVYDKEELIFKRDITIGLSYCFRVNTKEGINFTVLTESGKTSFNISQKEIITLDIQKKVYYEFKKDSLSYFLKYLATFLALWAIFWLITRIIYLCFPKQYKWMFDYVLNGEKLK
jgi:hypothetical protein